MEANFNFDYVLLVSIIVLLLKSLMQQNHFMFVCAYWKINNKNHRINSDFDRIIAKISKYNERKLKNIKYQNVNIIRIMFF